MRLNVRSYRKRGSDVIIEAVELTADNAGELANWAQAQMVEERDSFSDEPWDALNVWDKSGAHKFVRCSRGMYVAKLDDVFFVVSAPTISMDYEVVSA